MAPQGKKQEDEGREFTDDDLLISQEAADELSDDEILQRSQEAAAELNRPGTPDNPARAVERSSRPMTPEESAAVNPPWTPPKSPFAKYTSDPELQMELERASRGGLTSAVRGFNDWATGSNADEILGYIGSRFPRLTMPIAEAIDPRIPTPPARTYQEVRDEQREANAASEEEAPIPYYLGALGSVLATGKALPTAQGWRQNAVLGGAQGALGALGASEADLVTPSESDLIQAGAETTAGGVLGAAMGAAAPPAAAALARRIPGAAERFRQWLATQAERRAVKAAVGQNKGAIKKMVMDETLQPTGRALLDNDVIDWNIGPEEIRRRAEAVRDAAGESIGASLRRLDEVTPPGRELVPDEMAYEALEQVVTPREASTAGMEDVAERARREIYKLMDLGARETVDENGIRRMTLGNPTTLEAANRFKSDLDPHINWGTPDPKPAQQALRELRGNLNAQIERRAEEIAEAEGGTSIQEFVDFITSKRRYGAMENVIGPAGAQEAADLSNRLVSPSDYGAGIGTALGASLASGGDLSTTGIAGAGAALANFLMRRYGNQTAATLANSASREGGRLARLGVTEAADIAQPIQTAMLSGLVQPIGRGVTGSSIVSGAIDLSQGPEARSQTPTGKALYNALQANPQAFGRYADRLANAAENGEAALALQDYLLGRSDPEYAELRKRALGIQE